jgi:hypothetical protein
MKSLNVVQILNYFCLSSSYKLFLLKGVVTWLLSNQSQSDEEIFPPITEEDSYCSINSREGGPSTNQRARIMTKSAKMGRKRERTISAFSDDGISQVRKYITNIEYNPKIHAF